MSGFVLHPDAFADLDEIWEFIAADSQSAADRVREQSKQNRDGLRRFGLSGLPGRAEPFDPARHREAFYVARGNLTAGQSG